MVSTLTSDGPPTSDANAARRFGSGMIFLIFGSSKTASPCFTTPGCRAARGSNAFANCTRNCVSVIRRGGAGTIGDACEYVSGVNKSAFRWWKRRLG